MKLNKKASHVGMVLSFVIFVTFLIFVFSVLEPAVKSDEDKEALLQYLEEEVVKQISASLVSYSIKIKDSFAVDEGVNCVSFKSIYNQSSYPWLEVKKEDGSEVTAGLSGDRITLSWGDSLVGQLLKIYQADIGFSGSGSGSSGNGCQGLVVEEDFEYGLVQRKKYIFETRVEDFFDSYDGEYEDLKKDIRIPEGSEFGFEFRNVTDDVVSTGEVDLDTSVFVQEIPIQYIDKQANIKTGFIIVKVW